MPASRPSSSMPTRIGYTGTELQDAINGDGKALAMFETIRAHGAVRMGLIKHARTKPRSASTRRRSPSSRRRPTTSLRAASAVRRATSTCWCARMSMGKLHHAMMGTAAVAIGTAAAIPGTLVNLAAGGGAAQRRALRPSVRHVARGRRSESGRRRVGGHQGDHEPQRARADGRCGARAGRCVLTLTSEHSTITPALAATPERSVR